MASRKTGYEDITVGVTQGGDFSIMDDYSQLQKYYGYYKKAAFCDSSSNMFVVSDSWNYINIFKTDYYWFEYWTNSQELYHYDDITKLECKNNIIMAYSTSSGYVTFYQKEQISGGIVGLIIILASLIVFIALVIGVCYIFKKRKRQQQMNTFEGYYQQQN